MNEKEKKQEIKRKNRFLNLFTGIIVGMFICITVYLIYNILKLNGIEDLLRYGFIVVLSILCIIIFIRYIRLKKQPKKKKYFVFILILLIFGCAEFFISSLIDRGVSIIDNMNKDEVTYTSSLIAMEDGKYTEIKNISNAKIGIISDTKDVEGYVLAQNIIKENKIKDDQLIEYDDYVTMLMDLYSDEVNAIFISGSYIEKFSSMEKFEKIGEEVLVLDDYSKRMKKVTDENTQVSTKKVTEPFTMLLLGVDSPTEDISKASGLGDSIMLVTFNPKTLNATIFSIPRDTYVPISCFGNYKNKITHAASGGDSCMINTVENFTGIDIDYYAKVNFQGLIKLVDAIGGIDVDVPYSFCESNSVRSLSSNDLIYIKKGWQHLNGEQALALSRNRKTVAECGKEWNQGTRNDFVRGQNQQLVIKGIMNKLKTIKSINQLYDILDTISLSLDTNLTRDQILDFYNVFKKILINSDSLSDSNDIISMQRTYLNGSSAMIYDKRSGLVLYNYVPSTESLRAIVDAMKVNLELKEETYDNSFSFTIDEEYEPIVIGSNKSGGSSVSLLPSFIGTTKAYVSSWCSARGIHVNYTYKDVKEGDGYVQDQVIDQSLPSNYSIADISGNLNITLANVKKDDNKPTTIKPNSDKDDDKDNNSNTINICVKEGNYYYWYDSNGDKNPTKYTDSSCSKTDSTDSESGGTSSGESTTEDDKPDDSASSEKENDQVN